MIKGVIFDIGGVLAYDIQEYLFEFDNCAIVEKYNLDKNSVKKVSSDLWNKYAYTNTDNEHKWQDLEQEYWNEFKKKLDLNIPNHELITITDRYVRPVPNMIELLIWLQEKHFDLLICSNNSEFFYQRQKYKIGLDRFFEKRKIILSNHFGVSKDEEKHIMFKAVEKQMAFPKDEYIFVDDRKKNIDRGLQFGLLSLLFPAEASYGGTYVKSIIEKINKDNFRSQLMDRAYPTFQGEF